MKIIGKVITGICVLFLLWAFFSWVDVVSDNCSPNPQHSDLNLFVLMTESAKEEEPQGACGDPLSVFDVTTGYIQQKDDNKVWFVAENGNTYVTEVGNVKNFALEGYYTLMLDGDQVAKAFVEVW
jgi:hypothetical protein